MPHSFSRGFWREAILALTVGILPFVVIFFWKITESNTQTEPSFHVVNDSRPVPSVAAISAEPTVPVQVMAAEPAVAEHGVEPFLQAVHDHDYGKIAQLLGSGADVNATDSKGWSGLHVAALVGDPTAARILILKHAKVNAQDEDGWTPLHVAALQGNEAVVTVLLNAGAVVNIGDDDGWTPIYAAAAKNQTEVMALLLRAGADVNAIDSDGKTAAQLAIEKNANAAVSLLETASSMPENLGIGALLKVPSPLSP